MYGVASRLSGSLRFCQKINRLRIFCDSEFSVAVTSVGDQPYNPCGFERDIYIYIDDIRI